MEQGLISSSRIGENRRLKFLLGLGVIVTIGLIATLSFTGSESKSTVAPVVELKQESFLSGEELKIDQSISAYNVNFQWVSGTLTQISTGSESLVYGVNSANQIYYRFAGSWYQVPGSLKDISVGSDGTVWGVNSYGSIYRGTSQGWILIPGTLSQIEVGDYNNI